MSTFLENAGEILSTAASASSGEPLILLMSAGGQIHMLADERAAARDGLESLRNQYGCTFAYRVTRDRDRVTVEARDGRTHCFLQRRIGCKGDSLSKLGVLTDRPAYAVGPLALAA